MTLNEIIYAAKEIKRRGVSGDTPVYMFALIEGENQANPYEVANFNCAMDCKTGGVPYVPFLMPDLDRCLYGVLKHAE